MTTACAPGKIILFGEHAVVYKRPALAVPVTQVHATVEIIDSRSKGVMIEAKDISLKTRLSELPPRHALRSCVENVFHSFEISTLPSLTIRINSTIPVAAGLGSGAAVSIAIIRALALHLNRQLSNEQINLLAYEIEKIHHGTPSGIDNTVITYAMPVYYTRTQPIETFQVKNPFTIIIADTGIRAPTMESVADVRKLWENDQARFEKIFDRIGEIVGDARQAIESGRWQALGTLMDANQALLQEMAVSSAELDRLVLAARTAGARGAKLSGGGRGGNMIAVVDPGNAQSVAAALSTAGARNTIITTIL